MKYKRILICGSRWWGRVPYPKDATKKEIDRIDKINFRQVHMFYDVLETLIKQEIIDISCLVVIEGDAKGADRLAGHWANIKKVDLEVYPADWDKHGKAAGPIRNKQMLDEGKPDLVIAFLGKSSRGTRNMIMQAEKSGLPVFKVEWTEDMENDL